MNILPFTLVIVILLALFSTSSMEKQRVASQQERLYCSSFRTYRDARNQRVNLAYKAKQRERKPPPSQEKVASSSKKKERYFREEAIGTECGRLNLSSLLDDPQKWPLLREVAISYIYQIYGDFEWFDHSNNFAELLFDELIKTYKTIDRETPFSKVQLKAPFDLPFRKMARGTQTYDLKGNGYPPFDHLFTFEKKGRAPMNFYGANLLFLSTLLGPNEAKKIEEYEKSLLQKKSDGKITLDFLQQSLKDHPEKSEKLELLDFSSRSLRRLESAYDQTTGITVRLPKHGSR